MASLRTMAAVVLASLLIATTHAHGSMTSPPARGITASYKFWPIPVFAKDDVIDWYSHFPAGNKGTTPGDGKRSQEKAAGPKGWVPYEPTTPGYRFRSGPCGDELSQRPGDHVRGGKYYNDGKVHKVYTEGNVISFDVVVTAHHNGFMEFRVCDAVKCGGDITNECLRDKTKCITLERAVDASCESRTDKLCGPIDLANPTRWYLPCERGDISFYGDGKIKYKLPEGFSCDHCVVQWYWATANGCNPPGVTDYFTGEDGPQWGNCKGEGGAIGGYRRWPALCGGEDFSEEYYQCGDITINSKGGSAAPAVALDEVQPVVTASSASVMSTSTPAPSVSPQAAPVSLPVPVATPQVAFTPPASTSVVDTGAPTISEPSTMATGSIYPVEKVELWADGEPRLEVTGSQRVEFDMSMWKYMTFETKISIDSVDTVMYYINDRLMWTDKNKPYVFNGNSGTRYNYWWNATYNEWVKVKIVVMYVDMATQTKVSKTLSFDLKLNR